MEQLIGKIIDSLTKPESLILLAWVLYLVNQIKNKDIQIQEMVDVDRDRNTILTELTTLIKSLLYATKGEKS